MIFVNFKTYQQSTGKNSVFLAKIIEDVSRQTGTKLIAVAQSSDIKEICEQTRIEVWTQKVDSVSYGAHTGSIIPEAVVEDGAQGTLVNHSESKLTSTGDIKRNIERAHEVGLKTLVFATSLDELREILPFQPTYVSYEPAELIGSRNLSVVDAHPQIIREASEIAREVGIPLIVGAGVHSGKDVRESLKLGAVGVILSSDVVKSDDPKQELLELVGGFE